MTDAESSWAGRPHQLCVQVDCGRMRCQAGWIGQWRCVLWLEPTESLPYSPPVMLSNIMTSSSLSSHYEWIFSQDHADDVHCFAVQSATRKRASLIPMRSMPSLASLTVEIRTFNSRESKASFFFLFLLSCPCYCRRCHEKHIPMHLLLLLIIQCMLSLLAQSMPYVRAPSCLKCTFMLCCLCAGPQMALEFCSVLIG